MTALDMGNPELLLHFPKEINQALENLNSVDFLVRCRKGQVSRSELIHFLIQHYHYSKHFTRYLAALISNIEDDSDRLQLTHNLFEEMGLGDCGETPHSKIYLQMLEQLGIEPDKYPATKETEELISTMLSFCRNEDSMYGLGALFYGAEAIVPNIYHQILKGFRAHRFQESQLKFFILHITGDEEHALTMQKIVTKEISLTPLRKLNLYHSAQVLIQKRKVFFEAISHLAQKQEEPQYV